MGMRELAESIIMQSLEDLWDSEERENSIDFFEGEGVHICGELAGMNLYDQVRLFNLFREIMKQEQLAGKKKGEEERPRETVWH